MSDSSDPSDSSDESPRPRVLYDAWDLPTEIIFDKRGDLRLVVNDQRTYIVCSRALARASAVFDSMLYGGYAESKPSEGDWVVHLPEETRHGLPMLLDIVHGNVHQVRKDVLKHIRDPNDGDSHLDVGDFLCEVAITADKYGLLHTLSPWADSWLGQLRPRYPWRGAGGWYGEIIRAAWVFGDKKLLLLELDEVLLSIDAGEDEPNDANNDQGIAKQEIDGSDENEDKSDVQGPGPRIWTFHENGSMPLYEIMEPGHGVLEEIGLEQFEIRRLELLENMLEPVKAFRDASANHKWPCRRHRYLDCLPGLFAQAMGKAPLPSPDSYLDTIGDLHRRLKRLETEFVRLCNEKNLFRVGECCLDDTITEVNSVFDSRPFIQLSEAQEAHLEAARKQSRIKANW